MKKLFWWPLVPAVVVFGVVACAPPQIGDATAASQPGASAPMVTVVNDVARGQAVYVNESGERFDVVAVEDGQDVRCVEATQIVELPDDSAVRSAGGGSHIRALVVGQRDDGKPGIWGVTSKNKVQVVLTKKDGKSKTTELPESDDRSGYLRGILGWRYRVVDATISPDMQNVIVVGYAEATRNIRFWLWDIEEGSRIGVYWLVQHPDGGSFHLNSFARIIGVQSVATTAVTDGEDRGDHYGHYNVLIRLLSQLRLFFVGWYDEYMTDVTGVTAEEPVFVVDGADSEGKPALAKITAQDGVLSIEEKQVGPPPNGPDYPRLYIQTFNPYAGSPDLMSNAQTVITLYDANGNIIDKTETAGYQALDYTAGLAAGTYYIGVSEGSVGEYGIRVLTPPDDGSTPSAAAPFATQIFTDPYEPDDGLPWTTDGSPVSIDVGPTGLYRVLGLGIGDVDFFELVLPPK